MTTGPLERAVEPQFAIEGLRRAEGAAVPRLLGLLASIPTFPGFDARERPSRSPEW